MKHIDANLLLEKIVHRVKRWKEKTAKHYTIEAGARWSEANYILGILNSLQQEQEVDLEKFTEKMDTWKARFNRPDDIPVKATMAFTARMFYLYPKVAREWYDSLPKATQD